MRGVIADGEYLRLVRTDNGLTQDGLAGLAGTDVETIRKVEQGERLDLNTLDQLAQALGIAMSRLVRRDPAGMAIPSSRRDVVHRWMTAWDNRDLDGTLAVYHEKATLQLPGAEPLPFHGVNQGKDGIRRAQEAAWASCKTEPTTPQDVTICVMDDVVVLEGPKGVLAPNGETLRLWCVHIFIFDGDLVIDHRVEFNTREFAQMIEIPEFSAADGAR